MKNNIQNIFEDIISLFSSNYLINTTEIAETYSEVKIKIDCSNGKIPSKNVFADVLEKLNSRDSLHISIIKDEELVENYDTSKNEDFDSYIATCSSCLNSESFVIKLTIIKNNFDQIISIYYPERFFEYLSSLPFNYFLEAINNSFNGSNCIIYEVQNEVMKEFSTRSIKILSRNSSIKKEDISYRTERINKSNNISHCSIISKYTFIPEDFYPLIESESTLINNLFKKVTLLYSTMFLFDVINIDSESNISYKLNGYKTVSWKLKFSELELSSFYEYFKIYQWTYDGGNIVDKIGLVRNILSLNFDKECLKLSETTFEAVKSSYKIYQKENIKQYIEIRNKISDQLVELQFRADKIVDNFVSDFKKSLLAIISFFASVIVIKVVSKGDITGKFSIEETVLSIGFISISFLLMLFSRWEINKQFKRYENFYNNLKLRHTDILEESDIKRILNNDKDFNANIDFLKERKCKYTVLWIISLLILLVIIIFLYFDNQLSTIQTNSSNIIQKVILCFTKNT